MGGEGRGGGVKKESFEMSLFYFPAIPKASAVAASIILNAQLEIFLLLLITMQKM